MNAYPHVDLDTSRLTHVSVSHDNNNHSAAVSHNVQFYVKCTAVVFTSATRQPCGLNGQHTAVPLTCSQNVTQHAEYKIIKNLRRRCHWIGLSQQSHYHGLRGSASPVLTATGFVNGRWQFSTPTESTPLDRSTKNLLLVIMSATPTAVLNLVQIRPRRASWQLREI